MAANNSCKENETGCIFPFPCQQKLERGMKKLAPRYSRQFFSPLETHIYQLFSFFLSYSSQRKRRMTQTTLDFSPTFQRHHTTATLIIIMPSSSMPLSLTLHHHHHHYYTLKATTSNPFIINIIIRHPLIALDVHHLHQHNKELSSHTKQGHKQAQEEVDDKVKRQCLLMLLSKP